MSCILVPLEGAIFGQQYFNVVILSFLWSYPPCQCQLVSIIPLQTEPLSFLIRCLSGASVGRHYETAGTFWNAPALDGARYCADPPSADRVPRPPEPVCRRREANRRMKSERRETPGHPD